MQGLIQAILELRLYGMPWNSEACMPFITHSLDSLDLRQVLSHPLQRQKVNEWKPTAIVIVVCNGRST